MESPDRGRELLRQWFRAFGRLSARRRELFRNWRELESAPGLWRADFGLWRVLQRGFGHPRKRRGLQRSQDPGRDVARDAPCAPRHLHTFHGAHGRTGRAISSGASSEDRGLDGLAARLRGKGHARNK